VATVILIPKPGKDPEKVESYRPIALTSCLCKLMERIVNRRLTCHLESRRNLSNEQFGFRKDRSTVDSMAILASKTCRAINNKKYMAICSVALSNAYDPCWRRGILNKLFNIGVDGRMLAYFQNFMSSQTMKIAIGNRRTECRKAL
jgi:Reverse transcriptase (RNA-dependent DNA polymerase)